jgi:hypothetical protein
MDVVATALPAVAAHPAAAFVGAGSFDAFATLLGYAASAAVLATFLMRRMRPLRLLAILSNVLFVSYGYLEHILPVLLLHIALLPINAARLVAAYQQLDGFARPALRPDAPRWTLPSLALFALGLMAGALAAGMLMRMLPMLTGA